MRIVHSDRIPVNIFIFSRYNLKTKDFIRERLIFSFCCLGVFLFYSCAGGDQSANSMTTADEATLDMNRADSLADLAQAKLYREWNWDGIEQTFQQALELNPDLGRAHAHYGWYLNLMGRQDEALGEMKRAMEVEPESPLWAAWYGWLHWYDGRNDEATEIQNNVLGQNPDFPVSLYVLGCLDAEAGRFEEAIAEHQRAGMVDSMWRFAIGHTYARAGDREKALEVANALAEEGNTWDTWGLAEIYTALGEKDQAFSWLEAAYEQRHPYFPWIRHNKNLEPLFDDPRFTELEQKLELPESR